MNIDWPGNKFIQNLVNDEMKTHYTGIPNDHLKKNKQKKREVNMHFFLNLYLILEQK